MASFTHYLDLLKKSPITDGDDTFNVDTMLNENWDKIDAAIGDTTTPAKKLGLTGDLSVGASLGVLATAGDLHVWRRTKEIGSGGYNLVSIGETTITETSPSIQTLQYSDNITVTSDSVSLSEPISTVDIGYNSYFPADTAIKGKFFKNVTTNSPVYYLPENASLSQGNNLTIKASELMKPVYVPPGTYIDYPVSVNPNAYQAGSDAKPAGYTLGAVQSVSEFRLRAGMAYVSDSISVADDGSIVNNLGEIAFNEITKDNSLVRNKFMMDYASKKAYYIPSDSVITYRNYTEVYLVITKAQPVNTYPAIPAGTTIEYLGKLGDKGVTGSYVGTGTKGSSNPNKIRFNKRPDVVFVQPSGSGNTVASFMCIVVAGLTNSTGNWNAVSFAKGGGSSVAASGYEIYASYDDSTNELSWFCASTREAMWQQNSSGITYNYVAK